MDFDWRDMVRPENCPSGVPLESSTSPLPEYDSVAGAETEPDRPSTRDFVPLPAMESTETESPPLTTENPFGPVPEDVTASDIVRVMEEPDDRADTGSGATSLTVTATVTVSVPPLPSEDCHDNVVRLCRPGQSTASKRRSRPG